MYTKLLLDLETAGLNERKDTILEVGATILDDDFVPVKTFHQVLFANHYDLEKMDNIVKTMHTNSGLLAEVVASSNTLVTTEADLVHFIKENMEVGKVWLVGSSIHFDRGFIKAFWPRVEALLFYRMLDVSGIQYYKKTLPPHKAKTFEKVISKHRVLSDMEDSLALLQKMRLSEG